MKSSSTLAQANAAARPLASPGIAVGVSRRFAAVGLVAAMVVGSVAVWTVVPAACLMITSALTDSHALLVLTVFGGIPVAMAVVGKQLAHLERLYDQVTGRRPAARAVPAWRRSYSDGRSPGATSILDAVMVVSVIIAATAWIAWFLLAAGSPL